MESNFTRRFKKRMSTKWNQNSQFQGVPINKNFKSNQTYKTNALASTGKSVVHYQSEPPTPRKRSDDLFFGIPTSKISRVGVKTPRKAYHLNSLELQRNSWNKTVDLPRKSFPISPQAVPQSIQFRKFKASQHLITPLFQRQSLEFQSKAQSEPQKQPLKFFDHSKQPIYQYKLGGLGPNIGTEEWKQAQDKRKRIEEYGRAVQNYNQERVQSSMNCFF